MRIYQLFLSAGIHTGNYLVLAKLSTPTPAPINLEDCLPAAGINLDYLGKTICACGVVAFLYQGEGYTSLSFSKEKGAFYLLSYAINLKTYLSGICVQVVGEAKELSGSPVMVVRFKNSPESCP